MEQFGVNKFFFLIVIILFGCNNEASKRKLYNQNSDYHKSLNDELVNDTVSRLYPVLFTFRNIRNNDEIRLISFDNVIKLNTNLKYSEDKNLSGSNFRNFTLLDTIFDKTKSATLIYEVSGVKKKIVFENLKYSWRNVSLNGKAKGVLLELKSYDVKGKTFICAENINNTLFVID